MAKRTRRPNHTEKTKEKIRDTINTKNIVKKLQDHVNGDNEMKGTQIRAAETLLARTMPTLSMSDITTTDVTESYGDLIQGLMEMSGSEENFFKVCELLGLEVQDELPGENEIH